MSPLFHSIYRFISALFCAAFLLFIGAGTALANHAARSSTDPVVLQLKWTNAFQFAGYYVAKELGYYRAAGLQVEIKEGKPGINVINEVVEGKANFGISSSNLLIERANGKPVVALAVIMQHSPLVLITRKDKKIQSIHDLKGKRIMIDFARGDEILAYLKSEKISQNDFIAVEHSFDLNDLVSGKVDAIEAWPLHWWTGNTNVHFRGTCLTQHLDDCPLRVAANDRVINHNQTLAFNDLTKWVEL
jgi:ABC-type nitrate/sulfonate/bicarbonate transport system substrate-binding protein